MDNEVAQRALTLIKTPIDWVSAEGSVITQEELMRGLRARIEQWRNLGYELVQEIERLERGRVASG